MSLKKLVIALCLTTLVACASNQAKPPSITSSGGVSVSDSNVLTADIKARLKQVQDDYGVVVIVHEHQITVGTTGLITKERMKSIKDALHKVVGMDFKVSFLTD